jgi:hypothetical protein
MLKREIALAATRPGAQSNPSGRSGISEIANRGAIIHPRPKRLADGPAARDVGASLRSGNHVVGDSYFITEYLRQGRFVIEKRTVFSNLVEVEVAPVFLSPGQAKRCCGKAVLHGLRAGHRSRPYHFAILAITRPGHIDLARPAPQRLDNVISRALL